MTDDLPKQPIMIDNWKRELTRLWSIRVTILWAAISGLYAVWDAFEGVLPTWVLVSASITMSVALVAVRLIRQKDVEP